MGFVLGKSVLLPPLIPQASGFLKVSHLKPVLDEKRPME